MLLPCDIKVLPACLSACLPLQYSHAVVLVGYDLEGGFWIAKNSCESLSSGNNYMEG
jgi:hypothetical protein